MSKTEQKRLSIVARPASGFRRAGYNFTAEAPTILNVEDLNDEQIALLKAEPNLVVTELTAGQEAPTIEDQSGEVESLTAQLVQARGVIADYELLYAELKGKAQSAEDEVGILKHSLEIANKLVDDLKEQQKAASEAAGDGEVSTPPKKKK